MNVVAAVLSLSTSQITVHQLFVVTPKAVMSREIRTRDVTVHDGSEVRTLTSCTASYFRCMASERQLGHYTTLSRTGLVRMGLSRLVSRNPFGFATPTTATPLGSSLAVLEKFKTDFLGLLDGTNEGAVHEYLGCEVVRDWEKGSLSLLQHGYTERVLKIYGFENATPARTPLSPGIRLTKLDCPAVLDPALHRRYRCIEGHLSFLVQCMLPDSSLAYAELSKFVAYPGQKHMDQAEH
eukprot:312990-Rhodomonas_salina.1